MFETCLVKRDYPMDHKQRDNPRCLSAAPKLLERTVKESIILSIVLSITV